MKSNKVKIIVIAIVAVVTIFSGLFFYVSSKLKPEEIKAMVLMQTQKVFPNSKVSITSVDIGLGLNVNVELKEFSLMSNYQEREVQLASVNEVIVKIPIWAIITQSGVIEIKMDKPMVHYEEFAESNNWNYALGKKSPAEEDKVAEKKVESSPEQFKTLALFGNSKINVRLTDVNFDYSLRNNSKGKVVISKFLVKGLSFVEATAFEISSQANFEMQDKSKVSFDTMVIGEFNLADLANQGGIKSSVIVKLNNFSKTGMDLKVPEITSKINAELLKDGRLIGDLETNFEGQNKITAKLEMEKEIKINEINIDVALKDLAAIVGFEKIMDFSQAKLNAKGGVVYSADKKIEAQMAFSINPGIVYSIDGIKSVTTLTGEFKKEDISLKTKTNIFDGVVSSSVGGKFNPNEKFNIAGLKPFDIKVSAANLKIPEKLIRSKLWDKKEVAENKTNEQAKENSSTNSKKSSPTPLIPPSSVILEWNNVLVAAEEFSGRGKIITGTNSLAVDNLNFKFGKGIGKLSQTVQLKSDSNDSKFSLELSSLNLASFKAFLPPFIENFTGTFSGQVSGDVSMFKDFKKQPKYDVSLSVDAKKGEIKKLNISDYVNPLLANIPAVKDQVKDKQMKIDGNFETLNLKGRFSNQQYQINSFDFVGIDKKVQVTGSGSIYPVFSKSLSSFEVNLTDHTGKISEPLVKNTGSKVLPMKLSGPGFELKPDYGFTVQKLAKGALKTKGEEKLKEVVQKNIDKIVPEKAKEKVQGILNGLFKRK